MSCGIFTALSFIAAFKNKDNRWVWKSIAVAAAVLLFVSTYLAWDDEYKRAEAVYKPEASPTITVNVPPATVPMSKPHEDKPPAKPHVTFHQDDMPKLAQQPYLGFPTIAVEVTMHGYAESPVFEVTCKKACLFIQAQYLGGATKIVQKSTNGNSQFVLQTIIPAFMKDGDQTEIQVRSNDDERIEIAGIRLLPSGSLK
ncbi:hypothetical protein SAMN05444167_1443 [Terriglobus roseus]|uniref:Uncharacterized protein n=2 Tax=Terriglobus roseus TaxID=392734 RepID=A0A1G7IGT7_9BACT|nr:hypothetical protein SAMN05444167_1443 [Terriglobus roseus]